MRLPRREAELLDRRAFETRTSKRELVTDAVRTHLGMERGRVEFAPGAEPPEVLTLSQAAALLQVAEDDVRVLAEAGDLPGRRIGEEWRFSRAALLAWLAQT